jgi:cysteine desulfurase
LETIYLDNAATTPVDAEVKAVMLPFLEGEFGNPSSRHAPGVRAARALEAARTDLARAVGARPEHVLFTSGGTEANNLAVLGFARARSTLGKHVLIGATEHPCVREPAQVLVAEGYEVESLRLDARGSLDLEDLARRVRPDTVLVAHMLVNNEYGTVYPLARAARSVRAAAPGALFHVDAVQALGKVELSLEGLGVTSLALGAHKFHGPKGVGALVFDAPVAPRPMFHGGAQERGLRSGTENVAGIVGLARAAALADAALGKSRAHFALLAETLREALGPAGFERVAPGGAEGCTPAIVALRLPGAPAEAWMHHLEARGIYTSVGSACQAKKGGLSPALLALGLDATQAKQVLRISFARHTGVDEVRRAAAHLLELAREPALRAP